VALPMGMRSWFFASVSRETFGGIGVEAVVLEFLEQVQEQDKESHPTNLLDLLLHLLLLQKKSRQATP